MILALKNVTIVGDRMAFSGWSGGLMIIDLASNVPHKTISFTSFPPLDVFPRIGGVKSQIMQQKKVRRRLNSEETGTFAGRKKNNQGQSSRGTHLVKV